MNYLRKFSLLTAEVCEALKMLISWRYEWTWNNTYQNLNDRTNTSIKKDTAIAFYNEKEQLYLETRHIRCWSRSKSSASGGWHVVPKEWITKQCGLVANRICEQESNKCGNLIQQHRKGSPRHGLEKLSLLCHQWGQHNSRSQTAPSNFQEGCITLISQTAKNIIKHASIQHKNTVQPGPQLFIADWLSRHNHETEARKYQVWA